MFRALGLALGLALLGAGHVQGQTQTLSPDAMRGTAIQAIATGDDPLALQLANALLERDGDDLLALNLRSRALRNLGRADDAARTARQSWAASRTDADRYRAALLVAQALASGERHTRAQFWLRRAAQTAPTPELRARAIRDFRYVQARNRWHTSLGFSISPTSNANNGSSAETFEYFGFPLRLNGAARALSGLQFTASGQVRYRLSESETARTDLSLRLQHQTYSLSDEAKTLAPGVSGSDFAFSDIQVTLDREWITGSGANRRFTGLFVSVGQNWYGGEDLSRYARLGANTRFALGTRALARLSVDLEHQKRLDGRKETANAIGFSGTYHRTLTGGAKVSIGSSLRRSISDRSELDYAFGTLSASYQLPKPVIGALVTLRAELGLRDFDSTPYRVGGRRDVTRGLGLDLFFAGRDIYGFAPTVSFQATDRDSNVDLYDTRNLGVQIGIRSVF